MDQVQVTFWDRFWKQADLVQVDHNSLEHKLAKQGGFILRNFSLPGRKLLDVGCGFGFIDRYLVERADCSITGIDFQAHQIQQGAYNGGRLRFVSGDCLVLPFKEESFDMVLAVEMLHHLNRKDVSPALDQMCRVLKKGGDLLLIEVNRFHPLILALTIFDRSERNQFFVSIPRLVSILRTRFCTVEIHPLNFFLPTYKYRPPPLVEQLRGLIYFLEDMTEVKHLCMEYLIVARDYQPTPATC